MFRDPRGNDRVRRKDRAVADVGAVENHTAGAEPDVVSDPNSLGGVLPLKPDRHVQSVVAVVVADDRAVGTDQAVVPDPGSVGEGGDEAAVRDLDVPADLQRTVRGLDLGEGADDRSPADREMRGDLHLGFRTDQAAVLQIAPDRDQQAGDQETPDSGEDLNCSRPPSPPCRGRGSPGRDAVPPGAARLRSSASPLPLSW